MLLTNYPIDRSLVAQRQRDLLKDAERRRRARPSRPSTRPDDYDRVGLSSWLYASREGDAGGQGRDRGAERRPRTPSTRVPSRSGGGQPKVNGPVSSSWPAVATCRAVGT
jgi:hypothetical protein